MRTDMTPDIEKVRREVAATIHAHWKFFLADGLVMMLLGAAAIVVPNLASLAITIVIGWLFFVGGIFRTLTVLRRRHGPGFGWSLLSSVLAIALGLILAARPLAGMVTLTLALAVFFVVGGIAAILVAIEFRRHLRSWGWTLLSGVVDLLLAYLIWQGWPSSAGWAIGLLAGINMFFLGLSLLMTAIAARALAGEHRDG
jgi:uncharacterized membrane protein HdeD (DUF308 family)